MSKLIVGYGISGKGIEKLLKKQNISFQIYDDHFKGDCKFGGDFKSITSAIVSPGFSLNHSIFLDLKENGIPWESELDYAFHNVAGKIVCVTGTNGKSTTTKMIEHLLIENNISAVACGNIGSPPSKLIAEGKLYDYWIVETSSYQIEHSVTFSPDIVVITSLSNDHLARHKTSDAYHGIKLKFDAQTILPLSLKNRVQQLKKDGNFTFIEPLDYGFYSNHDNLNASLAVGCCRILANIDNIDFEGFHLLKYRFEVVRSKPNLIVNDSKSTNVESTLAALSSMKSPCLLLVGGAGKGEDFLEILKEKDKIFKIICFGQDGPLIYNSLLNHVEIECYKTLALALNSASFKNFSGDVLFSPGCASFDEFSNFEERGKFFNESIPHQY